MWPPVEGGPSGTPYLSSVQKGAAPQRTTLMINGNLGREGETRGIHGYASTLSLLPWDPEPPEQNKASSVSPATVAVALSFKLCQDHQRPETCSLEALNQTQSLPCTPLAAP